MKQKKEHNVINSNRTKHCYKIKKVEVHLRINILNIKVMVIK